MSTSPSTAPRGPKTLATVLGGALLALACTVGLDKFEGNENVGYRDIVGVETACRGVTGAGIKAGRVYTDAECDAMNDAVAVEHAEGAKRCTPKVAGNQLVAATMLTYNIGVHGYCRSTVARRFNAGDLRGGCDAFLMWNKAGGRVVRGLVNRREYERRLCLTGLSKG